MQASSIDEKLRGCQSR